MEPIDGVGPLLGTRSILDRREAIARVHAVGEQKLIGRMPYEIAWTTEPTFQESPDGRVIRRNHNEIGIPGEEGIGSCGWGSKSVRGKVR